jgi:hypothetical protein
MGRTSSEHRVATFRTLAVGLVAPPLLLPLLEQGGLAPVAIAAVSALLVGAPAAVVAWRVSEVQVEPAPVRAAVGSAGELAACLWAACGVAAALGSSSGWLHWLLIPLVWVAGALLSRLPRGLALTAGLSVVGLLAVAGRALGTDAPWTLLEPHWDGWTSYAGPSALVGALLSGLGLGTWTLGVRRPPGERHAPWSAAGLALLGALALVVERSARYEVGLGSPAPSGPLVTALLMGLLSAGIGAWLTREGAPKVTGLPSVPAVLGLLLSLLLAGPAAGALPLVAGALVPMLVLCELLSCAVRSGGADRVLLGIAALLVVSATTLGWPGLPVRVLDAALLGGFWVGAFWFVATRSVLARRST